MTIQSSKTLGGVGASLAVTGIISTVLAAFRLSDGGLTSWTDLVLSGAVSLLAFVGSVLFFVAMYGFSKDYAEPRIFRYILYGILVAIVSGVIIGVALVGFTITSILCQVSSSSSLPINSAEIQALILPYMAGLVPCMELVMLAVLFFFYRSYNILAEKSGVKHFRTAARILVLAGILNVVIGSIFAVFAYTNGIHYQTLFFASTPGAFIQYIAWAFAAKGFFAIQPPKVTNTMAQSYTIDTQRHECFNCGAQTQIGDVYCVRCGKKL